MARRKSLVVDVKKEVDGGESPNKYIGLVSVHLRVNWPPRTDPDTVRDAITQAYKTALSEYSLRE